jgi:hypothetical protein
VSALLLLQLVPQPHGSRLDSHARGPVEAAAAEAHPAGTSMVWCSMRPWGVHSKKQAARETHEFFGVCCVGPRDFHALDKPNANQTKGLSTKASPMMNITLTGGVPWACEFRRHTRTLWQGLLQAAAAHRPARLLISVIDSLANKPFMAPAGSGTHMQAGSDSRHKTSVKLCDQSDMSQSTQLIVQSVIVHGTCRHSFMAPADNRSWHLQTLVHGTCRQQPSLVHVFRRQHHSC